MIYDDYLAHHGVEGQKWGVRNGPPYPLSGDAKKEAKKAYKQAKKDLTNSFKNYQKQETTTGQKVFDVMVGGNISRSIRTAQQAKEWHETDQYKRLEQNRRQQASNLAENKLAEGYEKYKAKQGKANKKRGQAERAKYGVSLRDADKADLKASKSQYKADKVAQKGYKAYKKLEKKYGKQGYNTLSQETINIGKAYKQRLDERSRQLYS